MLLYNICHLSSVLVEQLTCNEQVVGSIPTDGSIKIMHKHHIIPKHSGGSDDAKNLIELSVEEHAEAHRLLYKKYGKR